MSKTLKDNDQIRVIVEVRATKRKDANESDILKCGGTIGYIADTESMMNFVVVASIEAIQRISLLPWVYLVRNSAKGSASS